MGLRKDKRTTREVEATRSNWNRKPYRNQELKDLARKSAEKVGGAWVSKAPVLLHLKPTGDGR